MGIYLSHPNIVKESSDVDSVKFFSGCSSMQGWRSSQEDAHNMIPDFGKDTALFAVYDGHGGSEVAKYTALHLPAYLKKCEKDDITMEKYLQDAFLSFDLTLKDPSNLKELLKLSGQSDDESVNDKDNQSNQSEAKENHQLKLTGDTPISAKISKSKKIQTILFSPHLLSKKRNKLFGDLEDIKENSASANMFKIKESGDCLHDESLNSGPSTSSGLNESSFFANESFITPKEAEALREEAKLPIEVLAEKYKNQNEEAGDGGSSSQAQLSENTHSLLSETTKCMLICETDDQSTASCSKDEPNLTGSDDEENDEDFELSSIDDEEDDSEDEYSSSEGESDHGVEDENDEKIETGKSLEEPVVEGKKGKDELSEVNHVAAGKSKRDNLDDAGLGKSNGHLIGPEDHHCTPSPSKKLKFDPNTKAESSINPEVKLNGHVECEEGPSSIKAENEDGQAISDSEGDNGSDDDDEEEEEDESMSFDVAEHNEKLFAKLEGAMEKPAYDSGCTAVVCLLRSSTLYVANVGDSRCIVSCDGVAHDMSIDHKPEDKIERDRIEGAGGVVTEDGRVNEGLNLSRALGDHSYKEVAGLSAEKQMISALPDVTELKLTSKHNFIVIACDGIWNSMSSQEVVDFVEQRRLKYADKPSKICEELFDRCLAPDTTGDGTGCDNMTCIIVLLKESANPVEA